jgi:phosphoribosylformylglycinamidine cyclo-ligase
MRRTFNCGVGMIVVVEPADIETAIGTLADAGESAWQIGRIADGPGPVKFL